MQGRDFLSPARVLVNRSSEADWRGAAVHAYYAVFLECRDVLARWGGLPAGRQNVHTAVRLKFVYAKSSELQQIGRGLEDLGLLRNTASYDLRFRKEFTSATDASNAISAAVSLLVLLDAIEADPGRRAAAIASLPP